MTPFALIVLVGPSDTRFAASQVAAHETSILDEAHVLSRIVRPGTTIFIYTAYPSLEVGRYTVPEVAA